VVVVAPRLSISPTLVKPGTTLTGTAARFIVGEALQYRLDRPTTGTVLAGRLTPAAVPAGGGGQGVVLAGDGHETVILAGQDGVVAAGLVCGHEQGLA